MSDFRINNLTIRVENDALPKGVMVGHGKQTRGSEDSSGGPGCGGCSCSCSCSCTCSATAQRMGFEEVEFAVLKESLKHALRDLEDIEKRELEERRKAKADRPHDEGGRQRLRSS